MSGLVVGGFAGVIRSSTPLLFALASGIQWFTLGTTFWGKLGPFSIHHEPHAKGFAASRGVILQAWENDIVTPKDRITASAMAGGVGGTVGGLLRMLCLFIFVRTLLTDQADQETSYQEQ